MAAQGEAPAPQPNTPNPVLMCHENPSLENSHCLDERATGKLHSLSSQGAGSSGMDSHIPAPLPAGTEGDGAAAAPTGLFLPHPPSVLPPEGILLGSNGRADPALWQDGTGRNPAKELWDETQGGFQALQSRAGAGAGAARAGNPLGMAGWMEWAAAAPGGANPHPSRLLPMALERESNTPSQTRNCQ